MSQWENLLEPQVVPLKESTHKLTYSVSTPSELQHRSSSLKSSHGIWGETEVSGIKASRGHCPFSKPSPHRLLESQIWHQLAISETPSTWLILFGPPWRSPETLPHPTYRLTQAAFPYEWLVLAHAAQFPKSSPTAAAGLSEHQAWNLKPSFTAWLRLEIFKPSTSRSHLRLLYSSGRMALGRTQVAAHHGLHHPGKPRACVPSGQL